MAWQPWIGKGPMPVPDGPARHDLLRPTGSAWTPVLAVHPELLPWASHGWPVICRRGLPDDEAGSIPAAVSLLVALGRARVAFQLPREAIVEAGPPPLLRDLVPGHLPDRMRRRGQAVLRLADRLGLSPRIYGSAMWQHVTGLSYLHDGSDLDLLWSLSASDVHAGLVGRLVSGLGGIETSAGPCLDGEVVLDRGRAVNWRELAGGGRDVLVKTGTAVVLMRRERFLDPALVEAM